MVIIETPETCPDRPSSSPPVRRQWTGALILTVTMLGVSAANYALNLIFARFLSPAEFGDANLAVNLVLVASAAAATLQLLSARSGPIGDPAAIEERRTLSRWAWWIGGAAGISLILGSTRLADMLHVSNPWLFVLIGAGLPVYLVQAVLRGALQGDLRLGRLAVSYAVEAMTRIAVAVALLAVGLGVTAAAVAISLSFVASAVVARRRVAVVKKAHPAVGGTAGRGMAEVSAAATALLLGQVVIANGDVILAKALMSPDAAGMYTAAAIIGRSLFFLSWGVVHSTFPVIARIDDETQRRAISLRALVMVAAVCVGGVTVLALFGEELLLLLLGEAYRQAAPLLVPYALATALFAVASLVASLDLAAGRRLASVALLGGAALQTALLCAFGNTPMSMVTAQIVAMAITVVFVCVADRLDSRTVASQRPQAAPATPRRRVLFLGTHGQANVGDELLLDTFLGELGPDHVYAVNSYDPAGTEEQLADRFDVSVFHTGSARLALVRNVATCDVVLFGGGNILKELYLSVGRWRYSTLAMVLGVVLLARLCRKPVLMANVGIGPVDTAMGRAFVQLILRCVWLISVRDEGSLRLARSVGCPEHKVRLVPDAVWVRNGDRLTAPVPVRHRDDDEPLRIAVNLNKDVDTADEWDQFLQRFVAALEMAADHRKVEFHALPMQCGFKSGTDLEVLRDVLGRIAAPVHIHAPRDHHDVASIIAECDLVVSERLHAIILAGIVGRPVIALPYDIKVRELVSQLGITDRSFDVCGDLQSAELAAAIIDAVDHQGAERDRLAAVAADLRRDAAAGFATLRSWVAAPTRTWGLPNA